METYNVVAEVNNQDNKLQGWMFWCPGCENYHMMRADRWSFNKNLHRPTFTPSLVIKNQNKVTCHVSIRDGLLNYHTDCNHELAGKTAPMENIDA